MMYPLFAFCNLFQIPNRNACLYLTGDEESLVRYPWMFAIKIHTR